MSATGLTVYPSKGHRTPGIVWITGTFQLNTGSNPDILVGLGFSVARTAAGKYTVTLDRTYHRCVSCMVTYGETGDNKDVGIHREAIDLTTTFSSFVVRTTAGAGTDTETDNAQVSFICAVADTTIVNERAS